MIKMINALSYLAALVGILVCSIAGIARLAGYYRLSGYETLTLFIAGVGIMVFASMLKLEVISRS